MFSMTIAFMIFTTSGFASMEYLMASMTGMVIGSDLALLKGY